MKKSAKSRNQNLDEKAKTIQKFNTFYEEIEKKVKRLKKEQRRINFERGIVIFFTGIGLFGLMLLAIYLIYLIQMPHIIRLAVGMSDPPGHFVLFYKLQKGGLGHAKRSQRGIQSPFQMDSS